MLPKLFVLGCALVLTACENFPYEPEPEINQAPAPVAAEPPPAAPSPKPALPPPVTPEEIGSRQLLTGTNSEATLGAARLRFSDPKAADLLKRLAEQPVAIWFTAANRDIFAQAQKVAAALYIEPKPPEPVAEPEPDVQKLHAPVVQKLSDAAAAAAIPPKPPEPVEIRYGVVVIKALARKDCNRFVTAGLEGETYLEWIRQLTRGLGESAVYIVLEPDALLATACLSDAEQKAFYQLMTDAVLMLKTNPKAQVYIDAGQMERFPVDSIAQRLLNAGVMHADGFALNVGGYEWTDACIRYGQEITQKIGGKSFIIDTARNGRGPVSREAWCNPKNRAIGQMPMAPTGIKGLDAYLWLTPPGISDGSCNGGPAAGLWWQAKAIELMRNAELPD